MAKEPITKKLNVNDGGTMRVVGKDKDGKQVRDETVPVRPDTQEKKTAGKTGGGGK